jgi:hypothetical protein
LAPTVRGLTRAERSRVPAPLGRLLIDWKSRLAKAPPSLGWMSHALSGREPVLELSRFEDRHHCRLRFTEHDRDSLSEACFGCVGGVPRNRSRLPLELRWLRSTFGACDLIAERSGSAQWRTLADIARSERDALRACGKQLRAHGMVDVLGVEDRWATIRADLPRGADAWVSIYETDGDWLFVDVERDKTIWVGSEWTGQNALTFDIPWRRAVSFVLWRMIDGRSLRPSDFEMLATK